MTVPFGYVQRILVESGGAIDGYGVLLAFPPEPALPGIDVELSQIGRCIVDDPRKRILVYPTLVGDEAPDTPMITTVGELVAHVSSLLDDRSGYEIRMYRRLLSADPLRGGGEASVLGTLLLHDENELWLLPTSDSRWAIDAAAL